MSKQFASTLGIPSEAGSLAGTISIGAAMQPVQIDQIVRGETKSMVMPPMQHATVRECQTLCPARMLLLEMSRTWHNLMLLSGRRLGWQ